MTRTVASTDERRAVGRRSEIIGGLLRSVQGANALGDSLGCFPETTFQTAHDALSSTQRRTASTHPPHLGSIQVAPVESKGAGSKLRRIAVWDQGRDIMGRVGDRVVRTGLAGYLALVGGTLAS